MIDWILELLRNPMFAGLTGATAVGVLLVAVRQLPQRLFNWLLIGISSEVTVKSQDPAFWWLAQWLAQTDYGRRAKRLRLETGRSADVVPGGLGEDEAEKANYILSPADGVHWFMHAGRMLVLSRGKADGGGATGMQVAAAIESLTLRVIGLGSRAHAVALVIEAERMSRSSPNTVQVLRHDEYGNWLGEIRLPRRPMETVVLREGLAEMLLDDAREFLAAQQWYEERGLPWRRGYLFHGAPGCGKSSVAHALATELGMCVAVLSLSSLNNDSALHRLVLQLPRRALLLSEDIDAAFVKRESKEVTGVTFSGVLNAIDGLIAGDGRLLVMTTNHRDRLDAALLRAGRSDRQFEIDVCDASQARRMFERFFPDAVGAGKAFGDAAAGLSPAAVQEHLMLHRGAPLQAAAWRRAA